jgi:hypothetical protein
MFACQTGGEGLHGEVITGCGTTLSSNVPEAQWLAALPLAGGAVALVAVGGLRRRARRATGSSERKR